MKLKSTLALLAFAGLLHVNASAQTFLGSDDFSAGSTSKWDSDVIRFSTATTDGNLAFANSTLEFTKPSTSGIYTNQFLRWSSGNGSSPDPASYTTSWFMTAKVTNLVTSSALTSIGIQTSNVDNTGYASLVLGYSASGLELRGTGTGVSAVDFAIADNTDVYLGFAWNASTQTLSASYSLDGTNYSPVTGFSPSISSWTTAPTDGFVMGIWGQSSANLAITSGQLFASSYSVSAVPEPSTYAAIAGLLMLGFAAWRRRTA